MTFYDAPETKELPSGSLTMYIERPLPYVGLEGDPGVQTDVELEVEVSFDGGRVWSAVIRDTAARGSEINLDPREQENAEVEYSERCAEDEQDLRY